MRPFDENAQCMKCGWKEVGLRYHDPDGDVLALLPCCLAEGEHLDRECKRCGFAWFEAPLNLLVPTGVEREGT